MLTKKHKNTLDATIICQLCSKVFSTKANRDRHFKKMHSLTSPIITPTPTTLTPTTTNTTSSLIPTALHALTSLSPDMSNMDKYENDSIVDKQSKYDKELDLLKIVYELKHENEILKLEKDNASLKQDKIILEKENQIQKCEKELYKQKSEIHEKDKIFAQDIARTTAKTTFTAVNGLTYVKEHYPNAPVLKKLDKYNLGDDSELIESLLFYSGKGTLSNYIGDFLIKFYKKNDPNDQSLWTTDIARLTFIVRQILRKKIDWHYDKKGIKVCNTIINPLLSNIKTILKKYINDINDVINGKSNCLTNSNSSSNSSNPYDSDEESDTEYDSKDDYEQHKNRHIRRNENKLDNNDKLKLVGDQQVAVQIITNIDNKLLSKDIIKYISPHLSLSSSKE